MIRRPRRTVPAVLVAVAGLAVAVLVAWSCIEVLLGRAPIVPFATVAATLSALSADQVPVLAASGAVALAGIVLIGAAVLPGKPTVLALAAGDHPAAGATRRSLTRALARVATDVDGIDSATVSLARRRVVVDARTPYRTDRPELADTVRAAVQARLDDIALARPVTVTVRISGPRTAGSS